MLFIIDWSMDWLNKPMDVEAELKKYRDRRDRD